MILQHKKKIKPDRTIKFPKMNFHTHTQYCDGTESVEDMVLAAMKKGFVRLGFSGHCFNDFSPSDQEKWCMSPEGTVQYIKDVRTMREKYKDQIEILCGIEQEYCSNVSTIGYDYVIGSVHYVQQGNEYYCIDESPSALETAIREGFGGNPYALVKRFFEQESEVVRKTNATIIGHFDLITKFNEENRFFDPMDWRYRDAALTAMDALIETDKPFEVNTGAIYRRLRTEAYPSIPLLKDLKKRGGKVLLSSDSHDGNSIGFGFLEMAQILRSLDFRGLCVLSGNGIEEFYL